jgi:hypothetical protein
MGVHAGVQRKNEAPTWTFTGSRSRLGFLPPVPPPLGVISREIGNFRTREDHSFLGRVGPLGAPVG